jgi:hypothetical protein
MIFTPILKDLTLYNNHPFIVYCFLWFWGSQIYCIIDVVSYDKIRMK